MDRFVGFLAVGYLKAASAQALGKPIRSIKPRADAWVDWLRPLGREIPGEPDFLRAYWYDGAYDPRHPKYQAQRKYFDSIADVPGIQVRLGHLRVDRNPSWHYAVKAALKKIGVDEAAFTEHFEFKPKLEQKGVDTRITLDMVRLAQRRVYTAAILVAGDRDLAEPVRVAQDAGCFVFLAIPSGGGLAPELRQLADGVVRIEKSDLEMLFEIAWRLQQMHGASPRSGELRKCARRPGHSRTKASAPRLEPLRPSQLRDGFRARVSRSPTAPRSSSPEVIRRQTPA